MWDTAFLRLRCPVKPCPYGKKGSQSLVARFAAATPENNFQIDESQPYGELWMGDHPHGPSTTLDGKPLRDIISSNPSKYLTTSVYNRFKTDHLPFLFKILSIEKVLPLQAQPDESLAARLKEAEKSQKGKPEEIKDRNHKPEVAVTLSETFEGFVGFRPINEIKSFLENVDELGMAINDEVDVDAFMKTIDPEKGHSLLKPIFSALMHRDHKTISALCTHVLAKINNLGEDALGPYGKKAGLSDVVKRLLEQYPGDGAMFAAVFFMNYVKLDKDQGVAVPADCIHAYLQGDIIECMAWSDNMIACGFQPESEKNDTDTFVDTLSYDDSPSTSMELKHSPWSKSANQKIQLYHVPLEEFDLLNLKLGTAESDKVEKGISGPSIFVVTAGSIKFTALTSGTSTSGTPTSGAGKEEALKTGQVVFVMPDVGFSMENVGNGGAEAWAAFVEG
ncbi:hypothetical protein RUND412_001872 [Rhizina undulata]